MLAPKCPHCGTAHFSRQPCPADTQGATKRGALYATKSVARNVTETPDATKAVASQAKRIEELETEVRHLKRELAEANMKLDLMNRKPLTATERSRKARAAKKEIQFKG